MRKILYLGLRLPEEYFCLGAVHYPIIRIEPRSSASPNIKAAYEAFDQYTHIIVTSKSTLPLLYRYGEHLGIAADQINSKQAIVVGKKTAEAAASYGMKPHFPVNETAEGIIELLQTYDLTKAHLFWPHSAHSRPVLSDYFQYNDIKYTQALFYDTFPNSALEPLDPEAFDEIVFTSPSTVSAFCHLLGPLPWHKTLTPIGPVTAAYLSIFRTHIA